MRVFAAELKKLLILFRADPKSLAAGIIAPTIILIIFALTFGDFNPLKLAWVNEDRGPYGAMLEEAVFSQISPLGDRPYFEEFAAGYEQAMELYNQGKVNGVIVVGEDFSSALSGGGSASIDYIFNNYNTDMAKNLRLYLDEGILAFYRAADPGVRIEVEERLNVETQLPWFDIIAVAVFLLAFLLGSMFNMLYLFYKEKVDETLCEYRLSPNGIWASLLARVLVALLAGTITALVNAALAYVISGVNIAAFLPGIIPTLLVLGVTYVFFAEIAALLSDSFSGAAVFTMASTVVLWFLSGATASIKYSTGILRAIALAIPNTYGLSRIRGEIFAMDPSVGGILGAEAGWLIMAAYALAAALIALRVYRKKLARMVV
ncbi:MAG TPA: ABC transporter permease [Candidatus Scatomorpha stercoravium]|nr:ABC transporter permease [Candidatus Scatomorpha stercoravium]